MGDLWGFSGTALAQPCTHTLLGSYDTLGYAQGVYVSGSTAYVADGFSGLQIIDVCTTLLCQCPEGSWGCIKGEVINGAGKTVVFKRIFPRRPRVKKTTKVDDNECYRITNLPDGPYTVKVKRCRGVGIKIVDIIDGEAGEDVDFQCR